MPERRSYSAWQIVLLQMLAWVSAFCPFTMQPIMLPGGLRYVLQR